MIGADLEGRSRWESVELGGGQVPAEGKEGTSVVECGLSEWRAAPAVERVLRREPCARRLEPRGELGRQGGRPALRASGRTWVKMRWAMREGPGRCAVARALSRPRRLAPS